MEVTTDISPVNAVDSLVGKYNDLRHEIGKVIVGQEKAIQLVIISIFCRGHCLLVGVPGLAKTLLVNTISKTLGLTFNRIQFTPDLMPSDIIGTEILDENRKFRFVKGAAGTRYILGDPFFVLATQNPIEHEGTYPLPEAQLDRFMFNILMDYPSHEEELRIVKQTTSDYEAAPEIVLHGEDIAAYQRLIRQIPVADNVLEYAVNLAGKTRPGTKNSPPVVNDYLTWGAGPRASQYLTLGAKCHAALHGKYSPDIDDVKAVARPILRHRIIRNYKAEAEGIGVEKIVEELL
ncbi:MAG: MoxR family ATPase [Bacteroidetes bacterium]|nr:MoxR family ATPase [Bacteroidota bacterium]